MPDPRLQRPAERAAADPFAGAVDGLAKACTAVEFVKLTGERIAFPYATLSWVRYRPAKGVVVCFGGVIVTITGTALDQLFASLFARDAVTVAETSEQLVFGRRDGEVVIESITLEGVD